MRNEMIFIKQPTTAVSACLLPYKLFLQKKTKPINRACITFFMFVTFCGSAFPTGWKAGTAETVITPKEYIWMAGYAGRVRPAEGKIHDLWAKALALEDSLGNRAVLVTSDLLGFTAELSEKIREQLKKDLDLSKSQIILNASHTHSGPVLKNALIDIYPIDVNLDKEIIAYTEWLQSCIIRLVKKAFQDMRPAELYAGNGVTRFQANRRNNKEASIERQSDIKGPYDHAVPVIKVTDNEGHLKAIVFGYACHPTTLNAYQWCGDYPGFAQIELNRIYKDATVMFFQGACGDQNPMPRGTIPLAKQHGLSLAAAVDRMLHENMKHLDPFLTMAYKEIDLPLTTPPDKEYLAQVERESSIPYFKRWAARLSKQLTEGRSLITSYPYPIQIWNMGGQMLVSMGGEVVIEYAIGLKRKFGYDTFVMGYSNDVMAYIPSVKILREGGYEGADSQKVYGLPSVWSEEVEAMIYREIEKLAMVVDPLKTSN
ncbi:MAG: neutral/alkaline non-lysosomal ceramidase N-terminal domain-containing protein [Tannerella sp.]|jgi:hypothetical protein|nr:neutral/alkaline non-lysosomal ceramidase N-terminal domain-containing protein [Tannerella sp.]